MGFLCRGALGGGVRFESADFGVSNLPSLFSFLHEKQSTYVAQRASKMRRECILGIADEQEMVLWMGRMSMDGGVRELLEVKS
jgi:hypothetical protein